MRDTTVGNALSPTADSRVGSTMEQVFIVILLLFLMKIKKDIKFSL